MHYMQTGHFNFFFWELPFPILCHFKKKSVLFNRFLYIFWILLLPCMCHKYCLLVYHVSFNVVYGIFYRIRCILSYMNIWIFNIVKSVHIFLYSFLFLSYKLSLSQITLCFLLVLCFVLFYVFIFKSLIHLTSILVNDVRKSSGSLSPPRQCVHLP